MCPCCAKIEQTLAFVKTPVSIRNAIKLKQLLQCEIKVLAQNFYYRNQEKIKSWKIPGANKCFIWEVIVVFTILIWLIHSLPEMEFPGEREEQIQWVYVYIKVTEYIFVELYTDTCITFVYIDNYCSLAITVCQE